MSVWKLYTQLFARKCRCRRFARNLSQCCSAKIRKKDIIMTARRWSSWSILILQFLILWWPVMKAWSTAMTQRPRRPDRANPIHKLLMIPFYDSTGMIYIHYVPTGQTVNKEYYVVVLREFRKRFRQKRPAFFKSGQWHFHQENAPVHNSFLVTDYLTKMGIKTVPHPVYSPDLAPWDFWLFPKLKENLEAVVMGKLRRWKGLWRRSLTHSHKSTSMGRPEVVGTLQVHRSWRRLLWRELEFHVCTTNKSVHTKKVWKRLYWTLHQITTKLERSEKMKPTNTWVSWRLTPSSKWKWKTRCETLQQKPHQRNKYLGCAPR